MRPARPLAVWVAPTSERTLDVLAIGVSGVAVLDIFSVAVERGAVAAVGALRVEPPLRLHVFAEEVDRNTEPHSHASGSSCSASTSSSDQCSRARWPASLSIAMGSGGSDSEAP